MRIIAHLRLCHQVSFKPLQIVMVHDPLGSVQGPTSFFSNHMMVRDPLGSVQDPTSLFFKSYDGA